MSVKYSCTLIFLLGLGINTAKAMPVTLNANDYAVGTDLTNAISGVTLQNYINRPDPTSLSFSNMVEGEVSMDIEPSYSRRYLSLGDVNTAYEDYLVYGFPLAGSEQFRGLSVLSGNAINSFSFTGFSPSGDFPELLFLFDKNDHYLGELGTDIPSAGPPCPHDVDCWAYSYSVNLASQGVYRIEMGGFSGSVFLDSLTVDVPEPSGLLLFIIGLFGLGVLGKPRRGGGFVGSRLP